MNVFLSGNAPRFSLPHYHRVLSGHELPYHQVVSKFPVDDGEKLIEAVERGEEFDEALIKKAFEVHDLAVEEFRKAKPWENFKENVGGNAGEGAKGNANIGTSDKKFERLKVEKSVFEEKTTRKEGDVRSLLELKKAIARKILEKCIFCERRCGADRTSRRGTCGVGQRARIASEFVHLGEEKEVVPSYTVFFAGCNFRCVYCQNWDMAMFPDEGKLIDHKALALRIDDHFRAGVRNVNFVGGNPDPNLHDILEVVSCLETNVPVIWNSNMYASSETMRLLDGIVDLYLGDFRYGNDECASKYSGISEYMKTVTRNFMEADRQASVIIRHLVLPGHLECCTEPIMEWVAENMPDAYFNLMFQYRPEYKATQFPEIARRLTYEEVKRATLLAQKYRIKVMS